MVVVAIMIVVLTMAVSGFQRAAEGSALEKALTGVASGLELARQTAISQSTYTWVFLAEDDLGVEGNVITMVMMSSKDGNLAGMTDDDFRLMNKVEEFQGVKFGEDADVTEIDDNLPVRSGARLQDPNASGPRMPPNSLLPDLARDRNFSEGKVVMFSPNGEAALDNNEQSAAEIPIYEALKMVIVPSKGPSPSDVEKKASSVVLVNGVTGLSTVHQAM